MEKTGSLSARMKGGGGIGIAGGGRGEGESRTGPSRPYPRGVHPGGNLCVSVKYAWRKFFSGFALLPSNFHSFLLSSAACCYYPLHCLHCLPLTLFPLHWQFWNYVLLPNVWDYSVFKPS